MTKQEDMSRAADRSVRLKRKIKILERHSLDLTREWYDFDEMGQGIVGVKAGREMQDVVEKFREAIIALRIAQKTIDTFSMEEVEAV